MLTGKKDTEISGKKDVDKHSQKLKRKHQKNSLQQMKKSKTLKGLSYISFQIFHNCEYKSDTKRELFSF